MQTSIKHFYRWNVKMGVMPLHAYFILHKHVEHWTLRAYRWGTKHTAFQQMQCVLPTAGICLVLFLFNFQKICICMWECM
jgi:hypothetical protein